MFGGNQFGEELNHGVVGLTLGFSKLFVIRIIFKYMYQQLIANNYTPNNKCCLQVSNSRFKQVPYYVTVLALFDD